MKKGMKATSLRGLLAVVLVLIIAALTGGFYLGLQQIREFAVDVSHTSADASASGDQVSELRLLQETLAARETLVDKANRLFATDADYQSQALRDIQRYANKLDITIENTDFDNAQDDPALSLGDVRVFTVTLQSPISYTKLIRFLDAVEGNLPKMQVASLSIDRTSNVTGGNVSVEDITIAISTR